MHRLHLPFLAKDLASIAPHLWNLQDMTRGQFLKARGVRQGCPASGFLFAMAFDPIFRWLQDAIIPRNPAGLDVLQPVPFACADDFAVTASSISTLDDRFGSCLPSSGSNRWAQFESSEMLPGYNTAVKAANPLLDWVATNFQEFDEMKIVKYAKYVGTMVGARKAIGRYHEKNLIIQRVQNN